MMQRVVKNQITVCCLCYARPPVITRDTVTQITCHPIAGCAQARGFGFDVLKSVRRLQTKAHSMFRKDSLCPLSRRHVRRRWSVLNWTGFPGVSRPGASPHVTLSPLAMAGGVVRAGTIDQQSALAMPLELAATLSHFEVTRTYYDGEDAERSTS